MDDWMTELRRRNSDRAWDSFLGRYRRLIFAAIRHYAQDYDDVMDVFARVCEALREDDLRRLRAYTDQNEHRAAFSTWLVAVVRNLTIDWFRHRDGRRRLSVVGDRLPPLQRRIFTHVFLERRSHVEAYELLRTGASPALTFRQFLSELRETYAAVTSSRRGHLLTELGPPASNDSASEEAITEPVANEDVERLEDAMRSLSPEDRVAVQLYVVEEMPAADVARVVGLANAKAVYNRVYRALAVLRERLDPSNDPAKKSLSISDRSGRLTGA